MHFIYFSTYTSTESTSTWFLWKVNSELNKREVVDYISAKYHNNKTPFVKEIRPIVWRDSRKNRKELFKLS